ncbi:MAG: NPCBM/NEW2 domain-containing protein, partial [Tannerella sp.]|nr:NPCBM/NEW2 domain-containing protein [Tannerella sp.]
QAEYGRDDASIVYLEVADVLRNQYKIDPQREVLVIFQLLLKWDGPAAVEIGPFVGGGTSIAGTAWCYDDPMLDPLLLTSKKPGGYYHSPCSIGQFNTHYIGGVAHELGHALSLPHECEIDSEHLTLGASLMGNGNHTFGEELRNEGKGTFLSPASALRLSVVRAFAGSIPDAGNAAFWSVEHFEAKNVGAGRLSLTGKVNASPPLIGIIAYNDYMMIPADYDAKTWVSPVDPEGRFAFEIGEFNNANNPMPQIGYTTNKTTSFPYQLRIVGVHKNGMVSGMAINYEVKNGIAEVAMINTVLPTMQLKQFFAKRDITGIRSLMKKQKSDNEFQRKAGLLIRLLENTRTPVDVATLPVSVKEAYIADAKYSEAYTGWGEIRRNHVPEDVFLQIGNKFIESGLYAHAPSLYQIETAGKWNVLDIGYGLQDGHDGFVHFIVRGDNRELFRSAGINDHIERRETLNITGIKTLQLIVEPASGNKNGAWGIWVTPKLKM